MAATLSPAAPARTPAPPAPRATRDARPGETAPLNVPITAAFIGLLLVHDRAWSADRAEAPAPDDAPTATPPGGATPPASGSAAAGGALAGGDGAVALAGGAGSDQLAPTTPPAPAPEPLAAPDVTVVAPATPDGATVVSDAGVPVSITLGGLSLQAPPAQLLDVPAAEAEPELNTGAPLPDAATLLGTTGDDELIGSDADDLMPGLEGNDHLRGEGGDDVLYGDAGDDELHGGAGHDMLYGGRGDDYLDGGGGQDGLEGGLGADTYVIGADFTGLDTIVDGDDGTAPAANVLRFEGLDRADLAITRVGDVVTVSVDATPYVQILDAGANGAVFHVETDDARFDLVAENLAPRLNAAALPDALAGEDPVWAVTDGEGGRLDFDGAPFVDLNVADVATVELAVDGGPPPDWLVFDAAAGALSAAPTPGTFGSFDAVLTATDGAGAQSGFAFAIEVVDGDDPPVGLGDVAVVLDAAKGDTLDLATLFAHPDGGDPLTFALGAGDGGAAPGWLRIDGGELGLGELAGELPSTAVDVVVTAIDGAGQRAEVRLDLTVEPLRTAPSAAADTATVAEDGAIRIDVLANDVEPDGEAMTIELVGAPAHGTAVVVDGALHYTPNADFHGADSVTYQAVDPAGNASAVTSADITVTAVNDAPRVVEEPPDQVLRVGEPLAPLAAADIFADVDVALGDRLRFEATAVGGGPLPEGLVFDGDTLSGTPTAVGSAEIRLTARDDAGASAAETFRLEVGPRSRADDVALDPDGVPPASVLPADGVYHESSFYGSRVYLLSDEPVPAGYAEELAGATRVSLHWFDFAHAELRDVPQADVGVRGVWGGDGDNVLLGANADDVLLGGAGDDVLSGAAGDDTLDGGAGDDVLAGGTGADRLIGGAGADRYEIGGLEEGVVDWIDDSDGANVVDLDGITAGRLSFGMDGADLVVAVDGADAVGIEAFGETDATFEVQADDAVVSHAALLAAVAEMKAASEAGATVPLADVLDGFLSPSGAPSADALAGFTADAGESAEVDARAPAGGLEEAAGALISPDGIAGSNEAAAAGLASRSATEEDPAVA